MIYNLKIECRYAPCMFSAKTIQGEEITIKVREVFEIYTKDRSIYLEEIKDNKYSYNRAEMIKKLKSIGIEVVTKKTAKLICFYYKDALLFAKRNFKPHADIFNELIENEVKKWQIETKN